MTRLGILCGISANTPLATSSPQYTLFSRYTVWHISEHTARNLKPTVYIILTHRRANFHEPSQRFSQERSAFRLTLFRSKENDAATRATLLPVPPPLASPPFTSSSCIFPDMQSTAHWILKLLRGKGPVVRSVHL